MSTVQKFLAAMAVGAIVTVALASAHLSGGVVVLLCMVAGLGVGIILDR